MGCLKRPVLKVLFAIDNYVLKSGSLAVEFELKDDLYVTSAILCRPYRISGGWSCSIREQCLNGRW